MSNLKTRVTNLCKKSQKTANEAQQLIVDLAVHAKQHGDWTQLSRLVRDVHITLDPQAMVEYVLAHTAGLKFNKETGQFEKKNKSAPVEWNIDEMREVEYWHFTKRQGFRPISLDDMKKSLLATRKRIEKKRDDGLLVEDFAEYDKVLAAMEQAIA